MHVRMHAGWLDGLTPQLEKRNSQPYPCSNSSNIKQCFEFSNSKTKKEQNDRRKRHEKIGRELCVLQHDQHISLLLPIPREE